MTLPLAFRVQVDLANALSRLGRMPTLDDWMAKPVEQRRAEKPMRWVLRPRPASVTSSETLAGSVPVRVYRTESPSGRALLYLHGGGFIVGGLDACDHICADLADRTDDVVVSVDYRLAPDDPFPAGLDDAEEALRWLVRQAASLGVDPSHVAIGGDSAGGNLTAALCLRVRDVPISRQVIIYPMLDLTCSRDSWTTEASALMNRTDVQKAASRYHGDTDVKDPLVSPLFATDLSGLPPALVITAQHDTLRDDGVAYAAVLADAGVPVRHTQYLRMPHGFLSFPRLTACYDQAIWEISQFLRSPIGL